MSYYFNMTFHPAASAEEALMRIAKAADIMATPKCAREMLEDNLKYLARKLPSDERTRYQLLDYWLYALFQIRGVYWPEYNLMAIVGADYPEEVSSLFTMSHNFQNGTDQDYDFESWGNDIPLFRDIVQQVQGLSDAEITDFDGNKCDGDELDYYRRSLVYKTIYEMLYLDDWLYGKDNPAFQRFACSGLVSQEGQMEIYMMARSLLPPKI